MAGILRRPVADRRLRIAQGTLAVRRFRGVGSVRVLRPLGVVGVLGAFGAVGLLGAFRAVCHLGAAGWVRVGDARSHGTRFCPGLRVGPVGVLGPFGRFCVSAGERWRPRHGRPGGRIGLLGVVGLLGGLGSERAFGVQQRVGPLGTVGPFGGFGLFGRLRVLGAVGLLGHAAPRSTTVGRVRTVRRTGLGHVSELGARICGLCFAGSLPPAGPGTKRAGRVAHRCGTEEGRLAGATGSEEVGGGAHRLRRRHDHCREETRADRIRPLRQSPVARSWPEQLQPDQPEQRLAARRRLPAARQRGVRRASRDHRSPVRAPRLRATPPARPRPPCHPTRRGPARAATACGRVRRLPVPRPLVLRPPAAGRGRSLRDRTHRTSRRRPPRQLHRRRLGPQPRRRRPPNPSRSTGPTPRPPPPR